MQEWQATYDWAASQPEETEMDGEWWWQACLMNVMAKAFQGTQGIVSKGVLKAPQPQDTRKSAMLTELYGILYLDPKLTIGQFKTVLLKVTPKA